MFDPASPVVDFGPTARPQRIANQRWVLWPVLAWKVLVPEPRRPAFNAFQQAVLSLCRAGVRARGDIAERLCLPGDLVRFVIEQLQGTGMLDEHGAPSLLAIRRLDQEAEPGPELAGYVFVDAHSGRLWPRFHVGSLPFIAAEIDRGRANFERGSTGRRSAVSAAVLWPVAISANPTPTPNQILAAVRQHSRRLRAFAQEGRGSDEGEDVLLDRRAIKHIRRLGTEPEPILVVASFFVPVDASHPVWLTTDPLGLGVTSLLQSEAVRLAKQGRARVREVIEGLMGEAFHIDAADAAAFQREVVERAVARIRGAVGVDARGLPPAVLTHLAQAEEHLERARQSTSRSTRLIDDFLGHAWAALEDLLGWLVRLYGEPNLAGALDPRPEDNVWPLSVVARGLGFGVPNGAENIFRLPRSSVQRALRGQDAPLNARLAAVLLAAERHPSHPLRVVARTVPDAVAFLSQLGLRRNDGSHESDRAVRIEDAEVLHEALFRFLRALLGEGTGAVGATAGWADAGWGTGMRLRLRGQAEQAVQAFEGAEDRPELRARLIEMHEAAILVELLHRSGQVSPPDMRGRVRDLVVAATIATESVIAELSRTAPPDRALAPAPGARKNPARVTEAARALGFICDEHGEIPGDIAAARPDRIREAAFGRRTTLSAMIVAQLLTAEQVDGHPLRRIAQRLPSFLLDLAELVRIRGHADEVKLEADAAPHFVETVLGVAAVVLAALDELET